MIIKNLPVVSGWRTTDLLLGFSLGLAAYILVPLAAFAQDAAPVEAESTLVSMKQVADFIMPYVVGLLSALIAAGFTFVTNAIYRMTGVQIDSKHRDTLHSAVMTAATSIWAKADAKIATMEIDVKMPFIKNGVDWVLTVGAPDAAKKFGLTPDEVAELIVSKLGLMQAHAPVAPPAGEPAPSPAA